MLFLACLLMGFAVGFICGKLIKLEPKLPVWKRESLPEPDHPAWINKGNESYTVCLWEHPPTGLVLRRDCGTFRAEIDGTRILMDPRDVLEYYNAVTRALVRIRMDHFHEQETQRLLVG